MVSKSIPIRSAKKQLRTRHSRDVIKLDVYSVYRINPAQLLYTTLQPITLEVEAVDVEPMVVLPKKRGRPAAQKPSTNANVQIVLIEMEDIPYQISIDESFAGLTKEEVDAIGSLKVTFAQYTKARNTLITMKIKSGGVKKRDAGRLCKMDVNKSGKLYDFFVEHNWLD